MAEIRNKIYLALYILHVSGEADASYSYLSVWVEFIGGKGPQSWNQTLHTLDLDLNVKTSQQRDSENLTLMSVIK